MQKSKIKIYELNGEQKTKLIQAHEHFRRIAKTKQKKMCFSFD